LPLPPLAPPAEMDGRTERGATDAEEEEAAEADDNEGAGSSALGTALRGMSGPPPNSALWRSPTRWGVRGARCCGDQCCACACDCIMLASVTMLALLCRDVATAACVGAGPPSTRRRYKGELGLSLGVRDKDDEDEENASSAAEAEAPCPPPPSARMPNGSKSAAAPRFGEPVSSAARDTALPRRSTPPGTCSPPWGGLALAEGS